MVDYVLEHKLSGGLLLAANKAASTRTAIRRDFVPRTVVLSLAQHQGAAAVPVVRVGDRVRRGQLVGAPVPRSPSAAVHASTSGVVLAVEPRRTLVGSRLEATLCVVVAADGRHEGGAESEWPSDHASQLAAIRDGGIVGLGGAVYPTADKLSAATCKTLIVNGAECEPYISCDDMLMREQAVDVVAGARLMTDLLGAPLCIVAIERDKPQAIEAVAAAAAAARDTRVQLAEVPTVYPAGGERQLIELLTGTEIPCGRLPADVGYVCQNVGTAAALAQLAYHHAPLTSRVVTVTGGGVAEPQNVQVPIGTPVAELIEHCGGYRGGVARLVVGGSMMGVALPDDSVPIGKASNCIIAATAAEVRTDAAEWRCIRCGECEIACPARLLPQELLVAVELRDASAQRALGLDDCIECGCCDVVCPSHIALTERFRVARHGSGEAS